ncbi:MAG: signal recognition particle protein [Bacteroidia bacterium]|nr:signal recognition particle protein [Bacteroidia bacterium]
MFENLSSKIEKALKTLKGEGRISEINIAETVREVRKALLDADVSYKVAKDFTDKVKEKALGMNVLTAIKPGELFIKIVFDELKELMGGEHKPLTVLKSGMTVILIAGLQGSGKTTFSGKLAKYIKKSGKQPLLVACDVYRPAAIDQLTVLAEQVESEIYKEPENKNAVQIALNGIQYAKDTGKNVVIIDTAGRLAVDEQMMAEIEAVKKAVQPTETLFVVDSMTGQDAVNTAKTFNDRLNFDGVVLTKLDGDTRGGAALSIRYVVSKPIKFISKGEKMEDLDLFHPERMASRILGFGDVVSLVERAIEIFDKEETERIQKKLRKNEFDFEDFLSQLQTIKKMGNIKDLLGMIPGIGKAVKDVDISDDSFKHIEAIIYSMTKEERRNPMIIDGSRRKRIAKGSGRQVQEINQLLKQFLEMKKMMKTINKMSESGRDLRNLPAFKNMKN